MDPREVPEVGEVLELAAGVGVPRVRAGAHDDPVGVLELGDLRQRVARLLHRHPQHPVALLAGERVDLRLARDPRRVGELRDQRADAVAAVLPAVVRAHDPVADDAAERERGAAVDAEVAQRVRRAAGVAPQDEVLAEQPAADRRVGQLVRVGHRVPARLQRREVRDGRGRLFERGHRATVCKPLRAVKVALQVEQRRAHDGVGDQAAHRCGHELLPARLGGAQSGCAVVRSTRTVRDGTARHSPPPSSWPGSRAVGGATAAGGPARGLDARSRSSSLLATRRADRAVPSGLLADPGLHEVIVVDDGSTDGTAEVARRAGARWLPRGAAARLGR